MTRHDNGIYYFLGNITSHVTHALPLYRELGGTFVVTSRNARVALEKYDLSVVCVDDIPHLWKWQGKRPHRITQYITLDHRFAKTIDFLNTHATVVLFYELFDFTNELNLTQPKKVFLTHGNMLKNYFKMHPRRLEIFEQYDYMAALGPFMKQEFIRAGIAQDKLVDIGIARTDEVSALAGKVEITDRLVRGGVPSDKTIVSYLPTFWGDSSVERLGPKILEHIADDYTVLFRPHPQTPQKILKSYSRALTRPNIFYLPEKGSGQPTLLDIYAGSSVIIGDVSSVMLEALLLNKPIIFAESDSRSNIDPHDQLTGIKNISQHITMRNVENVTETVREAIARGIEPKLWSQSKKESFFDANGGSVKSIANFVRSLSRDD